MLQSDSNNRTESIIITAVIAYIEGCTIVIYIEDKKKTKKTNLGIIQLKRPTGSRSRAYNIITDK